MTRISVVIPVLDDAEDLAACLRTLARQSRPADELIVVDNGSSDDSVRIAEAAGATVLHQPLRGIQPAASLGFDAATGDLIARCDADSRLPWDWLARIERRLADDPGAAAISGPGRFAELPPVRRALAQLLYMRAYFALGRAGAGNRVLFGSNFALRAEVWRRIRPEVHRFDPEVHDDLDLALALPADARVLFDPALRVDVSASPLRDPRGLAIRVRRAGHTFAVHGLLWWPGLRWWRRTFPGGSSRAARSRR